jgi:membrane dipeptidase
MTDRVRNYRPARRRFLKVAVAAGVSALGGSAFAGTRSEQIKYWDNHAGFAYAGPRDVDLLDRWRSAGVNYLSINVGYDPVPWSTTIRAIADYTRGIEARSDMVLCPTLSQVIAAWHAGQMALTFDIEGMGSLNGDVSMVELYYRLGIRQMLIAYNLNNDAGGGCHDLDTGLTDFGRAVVREMNRVGMVVDCAHSGIKSGLEAMKLSTKPCIFSHANARALHDHERNITDEQIKAVAATGGVVGVNGLSIFLGDGAPKIASLVAHIDYMAKLVGTDHVGIGLDYDPSTGGPELDEATSAKYWPARQYPASIKDDFLPPSILPQVGEELRSLGYKESSIRAIMSENFRRVASQVWAT